MAYQRYMGYQYETSPRKIQPEYEPIREPKRKKKSTYNNKNNNIEKLKKHEDKQNSNSKKKEINKPKTKLKAKVKVVLCIMFGFAILFSISYRNSLITESFNKKEQLKADLGTLEKENEQLRVSIENSLNLNNIEQSAKELLGMQKLDNSQKKYVVLPKEDYVESATDEVVIEEDLSWWDKIVKFLTEAN